jgi:SAM-dependent methyltransferase
VAREGHRAAGADLSTQNVEHLSAVTAAESVHMDLVDLSVASLEAVRKRRFDVISLFQVIEHAPDPHQLVGSLAQLQDSGGLLYLECPNDAAAFAMLKRLVHRMRPSLMFGSMKFPEHLHGFHRRAMTALLDSCGYSIVDLGDYHYRDGVHQVESEFFWPRLRDAATMSPRNMMRSLIPVFDHAMSALFGSGSGLFALGRKR